MARSGAGIAVIPGGDGLRERVLHPRLLIEVAGLATCWYLYRFGRFLIRDQVVEAYRNAHDVLELEADFGLSFEDDLQDLVMSHPLAVDVANHYYVYAHVVITVAALIFTWLTAPSVYRRMRRVLVTATMFGLVVHAAYPLAPPRLVPRAGLVDTLALFGPRVYSHDRFDSVVNQFAAMPSFHVGWAALTAAAVVTGYRSPWRWLAVAHPTLMVVSVIATANHYALDAIAGVTMVAGVGLVDSWVTHRSRPSGEDPLDSGSHILEVHGPTSHGPYAHRRDELERLAHIDP